MHAAGLVRTDGRAVTDMWYVIKQNIINNNMPKLLSYQVTRTSHSGNVYTTYNIFFVRANEQ